MKLKEKIPWFSACVVTDRKCKHTCSPEDRVICILLHNAAIKAVLAIDSL